MEGQDIIQFLTVYGYWIILPLMIVEGPIVTIIAAFMASLGTFHVGVVFVLSMIGDVIGDIIFYGIGYVWGMRFARRWGKYCGITEERIGFLKKFFDTHGGKTVFLVKMTTGLCWATFVTAGVVKMPFRRFVGYSLLGGVVWSGFLTLVGYFFGYLYEQIAQYIAHAGFIIFWCAAAVLLVVFFIKKKQTATVLHRSMNN